LDTEAQVKIQGDLAEIVRIFDHREGPLNFPASGTLNFDGKVTGDLARAEQTLKFDGQFGAQNFVYKSWTADQISARAKWSPGSRLRGIEVVEAQVDSASVDRKEGRPARGGQIKVGAFRFDPESLEPVKVPIQIRDAHIHWLAAPAIRNVFGLDFRTTGGIDLTVFPAGKKSRTQVQAALKLKISDFSLDNQKLGLTKPLNQIISVKEINLEGPLNIDDREMRLDGLNLWTGKSRFTARGKVDFETGYDLYASAPQIDFSDLGSLAETPIRGTGSLQVHVHGPAEHVLVDFDADVQDAYYVKLRLGKLKGRITYDDGDSKLILTDVRLAQGRSSYFGGGEIDLTEANTIRLGVQFKPGNIEDLNEIFTELSEGIWWFPRSMTGAFQGDIQVSGKVNLADLKVDARIKGDDWEWLGERLERGEAIGGYDSGGYELKSFKGKKRNGSFEGSVSYSANSVLDWKLRTEGLLVSDFDRVARLDVPVRGNLSLVTQGHGVFGKIESSTEAKLDQLFIRNTSYPDSALKIDSSQGITKARGSLFGSQASLDFETDQRPNGETKIESRAQNLSFVPLLYLINPRLIEDSEIQALVSGEIKAEYPTSNPELWSGAVVLAKATLAKTGVRWGLEAPRTLRVDRGSAVRQEWAALGNDRRSYFSLASNQGKLDGAVRGEVDASLLEFLTSAISRARGPVQVEGLIGGTWVKPTLQGSTKVNSINLQVAAVETPFENVQGRTTFESGILKLHDLQAELGGGKVGAQGSVELFPDRYPLLKIQGNVQGSRLKIFPFQFVRAQGKLSVTGDQPPYLISGNLLIDQALSREKVAGSGGGRVLKTARYAPQKSPQSLAAARFKLDLDVRADQGVLVQNDLFDLEAKGNLKVVNTLDNPRILGTADLIKGKLVFKDRVFQMQSGGLKFDNPAVINPQVALLATSDVGNTKVQMNVAGRMDQFKIELSSNPVLPESEILSLLALGATSQEVSKLRSGKESVFEQGEAASLLLHSLDFNREVQNKTGFQIQLDETINPAATSSIFKARTENESLVSPKIVVRRRLGRRATVSVGSTLGVGTTSQREVNLEYQLTPALSINGVVDVIEGVGADERTNPVAGGADLKLQGRFK
jgi:translocation and assembly module TamB